MLITLSLAFVDNINTRDHLNTTFDFFLMAAVMTYCANALLKDSPRNIVFAKVGFVIACCILSETIAYWLPLSRFRPGESRSYTNGMLSGLGVGLAIRVAWKHWPSKLRFCWTRQRVLLVAAIVFAGCYLFRLAMQLAFDTYRDPREIMEVSTFDFPAVIALVYVGISLWIQGFIEITWGRVFAVLLALTTISFTLHLSLPSHSGFRMNAFSWALIALSLGVFSMWLTLTLGPFNHVDKPKPNMNLVVTAWILLFLVFAGLLFAYSTYRVDYLLRGEVADAKLVQKYHPQANLYLNSNTMILRFEEGGDAISGDLFQEFLKSRQGPVDIYLTNSSSVANFGPLSGTQINSLHVHSSQLTWEQLRAAASSKTAICLRNVNFDSFVVPENATPLKLQSLEFSGDHELQAVQGVLKILDRNTIKRIELPGNFGKTIPSNQLIEMFPKTKISEYN